MAKHFERYLEPRNDYVILLEDLEFAMSQEQLNRVTELHNEGYSIERIAQIESIDPYEVIIAILHQSKRGKIKRPLAYRRLDDV